MLPPRGELRAWGSVLTSAFDLALRMGCDPVVFAGLDLAFTRERPYCANTIFDREWQAAKAARNCTDDELAEHHFNQRPTIWDLDLRGARIRTSTHLLSFRNWLLDQIARTSGRRFVNATDGGMLYGKGVEQATLAEVLGAAPARAGIRDRIREAWTRGRTASTPVASALAGLVSEDSDASAVIDRWRAFTLETVDVSSITAAVSGVLARLP